VENFRRTKNFPVWRAARNSTVLLAKGKLGKKETRLILPEEMMNNSGKSLRPLVKSKKQLAELIVVHDDIDLPLGRFKVSFNRGSAGHRGVESIVKKLHSQKFIRLRVGICPITPKGKLKKPKSSRELIDYLLKPWKERERLIFKQVSKKAAAALELIINSSLARCKRESDAESLVQKD